MNPSAATSPQAGLEELQVPIGELLRALASELAAAQEGLDVSSLLTAERMSGYRLFSRDVGPPGPAKIGSKVPFLEGRGERGRKTTRELSWIELGFVPTFYRFVETLIEVRLTLRLSAGEGGRVEVRTVTVDGNYASTYGFTSELSSVIKTRFVPVPTPLALEARVPH